MVVTVSRPTTDTNVSNIRVVLFIRGPGGVVYSRTLDFYCLGKSFFRLTRCVTAHPSTVPPEDISSFAGIAVIHVGGIALFS